MKRLNLSPTPGHILVPSNTLLPTTLPAPVSLNVPNIAEERKCEEFSLTRWIFMLLINANRIINP